MLPRCWTYVLFLLICAETTVCNTESSTSAVLPIIEDNYYSDINPWANAFNQSFSNASLNNYKEDVIKVGKQSFPQVPLSRVIIRTSNESLPAVKISFKVIKQPKWKRRSKRMHQKRALLYRAHPLSDSEIFRNKVTNPNTTNMRVIKVHSPRRIAIPVWYENDTVYSARSESVKTCLRCPRSLPLTAKMGHDRVKIPIPAVSICQRLAMDPHRLNLAVLSGPPPGTLLDEGIYFLNLLAWKYNSGVFSCSYNITVTVRKCPEIIVPDNVFADCDKAFIWGSKCAFSCRHGSHLVGSSSILCEKRENLMQWTDSVPHCVERHLPRAGCLPPTISGNGTVVCGVSPVDGLYPLGTFCMYFCYPGFVLTHDSMTHPFHCATDGWSLKPTDALCKANTCDTPTAPRHGRVLCQPNNHSQSTNVMENGTNCQFHCTDGFVIPASQLYLTDIVCIAPNWNASRTPECKKVSIPKPVHGDCDNRTYVVEQRKRFSFSMVHFPRFKNAAGFTLASTCTVEEHGNLLPRGLYHSNCKTEDPETRGTASCSFYVKILEKIPPQPREMGCMNITLSSNIYGTAFVKLPRFYGVSETGRRRSLPQSNCTYSGQIAVGNYINKCWVWDPELNITGSCTYTIIIKGRSCAELNPIASGHVVCSADAMKDDHPVDSLCRYVCDPGFYIPAEQSPAAVKICLRDGSWNSSAVPTCKKYRIPARSDSCSRQTYESKNLSEITYKKPVFLSQTQVDKILNTTCHPEVISNYGGTNVSCSAFDPDSGHSLSCEFEVIVTLEEEKVCASLNPPANGFLFCTQESSDQVCNVTCKEGFNFSSNYPLLQSGVVSCQRSVGLWDFQEAYLIAHMPDCLKTLSTTSVEVWSSFSALTDDCQKLNVSLLEAQIMKNLVQLNQEMCELISCNASLTMNCSLDESENQSIVTAIWTIQASFDPSEYEHRNAVPEVEIQIENVLQTTKNAVSTGVEFGTILLKLGLEILRDSYRQGHILLVCDERGFVVDVMTDKCVQCPTDTAEIGGRCEPCPSNFYQDNTGRTNCLPCPKKRTSSANATGVEHLKC